MLRLAPSKRLPARIAVTICVSLTSVACASSTPISDDPMAPDDVEMPGPGTTPPDDDPPPGNPPNTTDESLSETVDRFDPPVCEGEAIDLGELAQEWSDNNGEFLDGRAALSAVVLPDEVEASVANYVEYAGRVDESAFAEFDPVQLDPPSPGEALRAGTDAAAIQYDGETVGHVVTVQQRPAEGLHASSRPAMFWELWIDDCGHTAAVTRWFPTISTDTPPDVSEAPRPVTEGNCEALALVADGYIGRATGLIFRNNDPLGESYQIVAGPPLTLVPPEIEQKIDDWIGVANESLPHASGWGEVQRADELARHGFGLPGVVKLEGTDIGYVGTVRINPAEPTVGADDLFLELWFCAETSDLVATTEWVATYPETVNTPVPVVCTEGSWIGLVETAGLQGGLGGEDRSDSLCTDFALMHEYCTQSEQVPLPEQANDAVLEFIDLALETCGHGIDCIGCYCPDGIFLLQRPESRRHVLWKGVRVGYIVEFEYVPPAFDGGPLLLYIDYCGQLVDKWDAWLTY